MEHRGWPYTREGSPSYSHVTQAQEQASRAGAAAAEAPAATRAGGAMQRSPWQGFLRALNASGIWNVAVKRNGLTTSCVLLSGVLLADVLIYGSGRRPHGAAAAPQASAAAGEAPWQQQQTPQPQQHAALAPAPQQPRAADGAAPRPPAVAAA